MRIVRRLLILLAVVAIGWLVVHRSRGFAPAPGSALVIDLGGKYEETADTPLFAKLAGEQKQPLLPLLSQLRMAERDARITTVLIKVHSLSLGWGKAQELRDAIAALREKGRHPIAYVEVEGFGANLEYYVASAAEEVWLAPATRTPFVGLAAEFLFLGGLWEKLGVQIDVERIGEYKSAAEIFAAKEMSEPHREMANALLDSMSEQFVAGVARSRGIPEEQVRSAIDTAPMTPEGMKAAGLVTGIAYPDEILKQRGDPPVVEAEDYARVDPSSLGFAPKASFAVIYGAGPVQLGEARLTREGPTLSSEPVAKALRDAADDPEIRAILFRIDSPGGSPLASDLVWHAVQDARRKKPVVASVSDMAASGGYYVIAGTDGLVAPPGALVGSIGVFVLRPVLGGLFEKLGVGYTALQRGAHADLLLSGEQMSEGTRDRLREEVRSTYDLFVKRVSDGRGLAPERVDAVGRGRVWTGAQGAEIGLVDSLGGLRVATNLAKEKAGLAKDDDVLLVPYPPPRPFLEQLRDAVSEGGVRAVGAALRASALPALPEPVTRLASWLASVPTGAPVLLPPIAVEIR
jgi:protease-4